ncbi:recombinase family protein [Pseudomonas sp.]|uniref:recombinase family protein n=1 Tax=Pseudomonas sp. TaxID=306 RepID=UPI002FC761A3
MNTQNTQETTMSKTPVVAYQTDSKKMAGQPVVAYIRVSTGKQESSGLGLEAQKAYIEAAAQQQGWNIVEWCSDTCSGSVAPQERPAMAQALASGLPIVAAKLDRLSRDVEHMAGLMKRAQVKVATMPTADNFQLHLFAALAEQERTFIKQRVKDALGALQARADGGCGESVQKIANRSQALSQGRTHENTNKARAIRSEKAREYAQSVRHHVESALYTGAKTLQQIADVLNERGVKTSTGGLWWPATVKQLRVVLGL